PEVAGAGVILHTAVHVFDALRYITGREVVRLKATRFCRHSRRCEDLFMAMLEMEGGLVGTVDASKVGPARLGRFEFVGENGQLQGDQIHNFVEFVHGTEVSSIALAAPASTLIPLLNGWRDFLLGSGKNPVAGEEGAAAVAIAEACLLSAERDVWVSL
ncbi:MAG: Gfo/Idh/MocA family oxidoreductase, partial [Deltaproteobacteria bacterium]